MLQYVRKYFYLYFVITLIPAMIYVATIVVAGGAYGLVSGWTWAITFVLVVATSIVASRTLNRAAGAEMKKTMQLFYEKCDPALFLEQGAEIARRIKAPFNEWGSLFMCAYGLAYIEVGNKERAVEVVESMRDSAQFAKRPAEAAHILLNMHAPIKELYGTDLALSCLTEAEKKLVTAKNKVDFSEEKEYIDQERMVDIADKFSDDSEIIRLYSTVFDNKRIFKRTRVMAAYYIACAYRRMEEYAQEKHYLEFVVENGNKLLVVEYAQARIPEIPSMSEVSVSFDQEHLAETGSDSLVAGEQ